MSKRFAFRPGIKESHSTGTYSNFETPSFGRMYCSISYSMPA